MAFFTFRQNNSGGAFDIDDSVDRFVIIEASNSDEANNRALDIGIYFNGCDNEIDCPCCGDRWFPVWKDDATESPEIYGDFASDRNYPFIIYYSDGKIDRYHGG